MKKLVICSLISACLYGCSGSESGTQNEVRQNILSEENKALFDPLCKTYSTSSIYKRKYSEYDDNLHYTRLLFITSKELADEELGGKIGEYISYRTLDKTGNAECARGYISGYGYPTTSVLSCDIKDVPNIDFELKSVEFATNDEALLFKSKTQNGNRCEGYNIFIYNV